MFNLTKNYKKIGLILIFIFLCFLVLGFLISQKIEKQDKFIYVNSSVSNTGNGTASKPFKTISEALSATKNGYKIFLFPGLYEGNFTISSRISIVGENSDNVIVSGPIYLDHSSSLKNLTVSGGIKAINVKPNSSVEIDNIIVENASNVGIDLPEGNATLLLSNSEIRKNGKGIYVQSGNRIEITGSDFHNNNEESIDIRNSVDGFIKNTKIHENNEPGVELILGGSVLEISNTTINNNDSNGIAPQYYQDFSEDGFLILKNNIIENNSKYGIKCNSPSGGGAERNYWFNAISLQDNLFSNNSDGDINNKCKLLTNGSARDLSREEQVGIYNRNSQIDTMISKNLMKDKVISIEKGITFLENDIAEENSRGFFTKLLYLNKNNANRIKKDIEELKKELSLLKSLNEENQSNELKLEISKKTDSFEQAISREIGKLN